MPKVVLAFEENPITQSYSYQTDSISKLPNKIETDISFGIKNLQTSKKAIARCLEKASSLPHAQRNSLKKCVAKLEKSTTYTEMKTMVMDKLASQVPHVLEEKGRSISDDLVYMIISDALLLTNLGNLDSPTKQELVQYTVSKVARMLNAPCLDEVIGEESANEVKGGLIMKEATPKISMPSVVNTPQQSESISIQPQNKQECKVAKKKETIQSPLTVETQQV